MESVTCECGWWKVINVLGSSSHAMPCVITSWRFHYHYYHNLLNNTCCFNIHREINIVTEFIVLSYLPGSSGRPESHSNKLAHTEGQNLLDANIAMHYFVEKKEDSTFSESLASWCWDPRPQGFRDSQRSFKARRLGKWKKGKVKKKRWNWINIDEQFQQVTFNRNFHAPILNSEHAYYTDFFFWFGQVYHIFWRHA